MKRILYYLFGILVILLGIAVTFFPILIAISWGCFFWIFAILITWIPGVDLIWKGALLLRLIS